MSKTQNAAKTEANKTEAAAPVKAARTAPAAKKTSTVSKAVALVGTPAELIAAGVTLNGQAIDGPAITFLRKHFYKKAIDTNGYMPKPQGQKGKSVEIVELLNAPGFEFANPSAAASV